MATGDGFTDGQISDPVAIGDFGMYHQTASTTSSFTVEVEFGCKLYTEHWVKYRAKVTANGSSYYSQEGIGLDPRVDTREGIPFTFKTNVTGLPSGRTFVYTVQIQWYDLELSSDTWHDGGEPHKKIGATDGIPLPFNWQTTNYSRYHPELDSDAGYGLTGEYYTGIDGGRYSALSRFNASAAQTQKAYNAVKNGGRTSDFNTRVWNDLMDHIAWVQNEWGISENKAVNRVWPAPYISDLDPPYKKDIAIGDLVVKTDAGAAGRTITASVFNIATEAIPIVNTWPWEKELGRKKIMPNDICKGSYFLALVDTLNHWISLTPLPIVITSNIANQSMSGKMTQLPSVPVESSGSFGLSCQFTPDNVQTIQGAHTARVGKLVDTFEVTVENGVLPFASQFNFWDFDSSCKAASVTAYVIGKFNGIIKQPTQVIDIGFASTLTIQSSGQIAAPKHIVDLTAPPGCVIGEHGYTLHTQSAFQIGTAPAFYLEHDGIFGVVNEFTITPKDNDQSVLEGTIGFVDTIDGMITEPGVVMEYSKQLSMSDSFTASTSTGNVMSQDAQIRLVGATDITSSTIIPLELDGNVSMSATVDDMREGRIFEIVDGSASVAIKPTSEVAVINTVGLSSTDTRVGVSAIAENNANDPIELDGNVTATVGLDESVLNSQRDVLISASANNTIKSVSTVNSAKRKIVDGSASVAIKPTSEVAVINTVGLSSTDTRVGVSAIAENNANDPIELDGNVTATVGLDESVLNSQRDVLISASANNTIKSVSTVNSAKRKIVDGSASVAIKPTSEVATAKPKQAESHEVLVTEESVGTLIRKPRVHMSSAVVDIMSTTETTMGAINMTHTRSVSVDERVVVGGIAEMAASKGQKEIGIEHVETVNAEAVLAYKVPTALNSSEAVRIDAIGTADKSSSYLIESESETVLVRSEASLSLGTVSLILASELDDTLVSELDDTFAYDAERIIRITANNDSNTK